MPSVRDIINAAKNIKSAVSNELTEKQKEDFRNKVADPEVQKKLQQFKLAKEVTESNKEFLGNIAHVEGINAAAGRSVEFKRSEKTRIEEMTKAFEKQMAQMLKDNPLIEKQFKYAEKHQMILDETYNGMGAPEADQPTPAVAQPPATQHQAGAWQAGTTGAAIGPRPAAGDGSKVSIGRRPV